MAFNILIVDDSETVRAVVGKTLRLSGIPLGEMHEAGNGREALDILRARWIDLVLTDINMPEMDGLEMIRRMGEDGLLATIPVIVVSSHGSKPQIERLRSQGVMGYVQKPFTPETIREITTEVLGAFHDHRGQQDPA